MVAFWFLAITIGLGALMGKFAESKGYGFWNWFFASSLLGIIWLVVVPNLKTSTTFSEEEVAKKTSSTNTAGVIVGVIGQVFALLQLASVYNVG